MPISLRQKQSPGFALLMTIVVVSVIISIGLTVLDLSIKQIRLSTNAKDSEIAFHAANSGIECAQYWRRASSSQMERGQSISPRCFGTTVGQNTVSEITNGVAGDGEVFQYRYEFTWGGTDARCTQINTLVASSTVLGSGLTITNNALTAALPGYPEVGSKVCNAGEQCTVVSVRGYNRTCATINGFGTVQREVLLQF
jgi:type II secretory pathway pseudopilin PulG